MQYTTHARQKANAWLGMFIEECSHATFSKFISKKLKILKDAEIKIGRWVRYKRQCTNNLALEGLERGLSS